MKSNYKKLGDYIRIVDERNKDNQVARLLGVSIEKKFIESIANTIGTDMSIYKIVKKGQFAYGPVTSRNGDKVSIALLEEEECIISSSYSVFEIIDTNLLLPEYLNLWFKRPEFDRYARFHSHGSAREIFDWDEMCNVELPIPEIDEQKKIVEAYNTIERRIALKRQINDNLVSTAKTILQQFITSNDCLSKQPIGDICLEVKAGGTPSRTTPSYWENGMYYWVKNGEVKNNIITGAEELISQLGYENSSAKLVKKNSVLMAMYCVSTPQLAYTDIEVTTNQAVCAMTTQNKAQAAYLYYYLMFFGQELVNDANGSAQINLSKEIISNYSIPMPDDTTIESMKLVENIEYRTQISKEIDALTTLAQLLIGKLSR